MELNKKRYLTLQKVLKNQVAVGIEEKNTFLSLDENFWYGHEYFKVFKVCSYDFNGDGIHGTNFYAIFDANKIRLDEDVVLKVPKGFEGLFIGKRAWQVKKWSEALGVKRINVVGI